MACKFEVAVSGICRYLLRQGEATRARDIKTSTSSRKLSFNDIKTCLQVFFFKKCKGIILIIDDVKYRFLNIF